MKGCGLSYMRLIERLHILVTCTISSNSELAKSPRILPVVKLDASLNIRPVLFEELRKEIEALASIRANTVHKQVVRI